MARIVNEIPEDSLTLDDLVISTKRELWIHTIKTYAIGVVAGAAAVGLVIANHKINQDKDEPEEY